MVVHGLVLSLVASAWLLMVLRINPRLMVQDYPKDIQAAVPPKTGAEQRMSMMLGVPFLVMLVAVLSWSTWDLKQQLGESATLGRLAVHAFGVGSIFNLVDWLVLDWALFCAITPDFMVIPGTAGMAGYKNYAFHFRGFLIGTVLSAVMGLLVGAAVYAS